MKRFPVSNEASLCVPAMVKVQEIFPTTSCPKQDIMERLTPGQVWSYATAVFLHSA